MLPYSPQSTLRSVAEGIWWVDGPIVHMKLGLVSLPFPTRMVVIRLASGGLWLWSPTAPTPQLCAELDALGPVEHLVSPNRFHYAGIPAWKQLYPRATAWASPGVRARARSHAAGFTFDADLGDDAPPSWAGDIEQLVFRGSFFIEEVVFFHRASSTLVLADLVMALERERLRGPMRWLMQMAGATWPGQTPREIQATSLFGRSRARECRRRILAWNPARVIVAHGRCYLEDATAQLGRALSWLG